MKVSEAFPSKYLKVEDLNDQDLTLTIESTSIEQLGQGEERQQKLIVYFKEVEKGLACNKTNANTIAKMYGDETAEWIGQRITLWPNHDVEFKGEVVSAIRVRSRKPAGGRAPVADGLLSWSDAVTLAQTVGIGEQELKDYLKQHGIAGYNRQSCTPLVRELVAGFDPAPLTDDDPNDIPF